MQYETIPASVQAFMDRITALCGEEHADWARNFNACFANTLTTTVRRHEDGTTFVLTGDIPAMWLRDSTAQVRPYLAIAGDDPDLADMIAGLVRLQFRYIGIDAYANAFNEEPNGATWDPDDRSDFFSPWLWERKYELDSLCYPLQLAWLLYANTGHTDHFDATFAAGVRRILVAGGETSGAVVSRLGVRALRIGETIAPGVPWTETLLDPANPGAPHLALALKSGNFGGEDFFMQALGLLANAN